MTGKKARKALTFLEDRRKKEKEYQDSMTHISTYDGELLNIDNDDDVDDDMLPRLLDAYYVIQ